jgi:thioredoxin-related protein
MAKRYVVSALLAVILVLGASWPVFAKGYKDIHWVTYEDALQKQRELKKPVLIFFHLPYCYRCKEMIAWVYSKPEVIDFINRNFIPVTVDMDKDKSLVKQMNVTYPPTHIFLAPDGKEALRVKGSISKDRFLKILEFVSGEEYKKMDLDSYLKGGS